jgi:hypothetical protein
MLIAPLNAATLTTRRRASATAAATAPEASARQNGAPFAEERGAEAKAAGKALSSLGATSTPHMAKVIGMEMGMLEAQIVSQARVVRSGGSGCLRRCA